MIMSRRIGTFIKFLHVYSTPLPYSVFKRKSQVTFFVLPSYIPAKIEWILIMSFIHGKNDLMDWNKHFMNKENIRINMNFTTNLEYRPTIFRSKVIDEKYVNDLALDIDIRFYLNCLLLRFYKVIKLARYRTNIKSLPVINKRNENLRNVLMACQRKYELSGLDFKLWWNTLN